MLAHHTCCLRLAASSSGICLMQTTAICEAMMSEECFEARYWRAVSHMREQDQMVTLGMHALQD